LKHFQCLQGSEAWLRARMGRPTASEFERLIQPKKLEPTKSETRRNYAIFLLTELILDYPLSGVTTAAMNHGTSYEENARSAYEMLIGQEVEMAGFCTNDAETYGASPDAFVGEDGLAEFKAPFKPEIHVEYMMEPKSLESEYMIQTQGEIFVCERSWVDLVSYHSVLPMVRVRVEPIKNVQDKLSIAVHSFCAEFSDLVDRAIELGYLAKRPVPPTVWFDESFKRGRRFDISDSEMEKIWAKEGISDADVDDLIRAGAINPGGRG